MQQSAFRILIIAAVILLGCNLSLSPATQAPPAAGGGPKTSFDDPQANAVVPPGARKILLHAQDPSGVARAEFSVNGTLLSTQESPDPKKSNVSFTFAWDPPAEGDYLLQARAQNSQGAWGQDVIITIHVEKKKGAGNPSAGNGESGGPATVNPPPAATTEKPPTPTHTPRATHTPALTATSATITFTPDVTPKNIFKHGAACDSSDLVVKVTVTGAVDNVVVFFKLFDYSSYAGITDYDAGTALTPKGGGVYSKTFNSTNFPSAPPFVKAWVGYQFAAERFPSGGGDAVVVGRSNTYSDVTLNAVCPL